jgi:hypothetical protein
VITIDAQESATDQDAGRAAPARQFGIDSAYVQLGFPLGLVIFLSSPTGGPTSITAELPCQTGR